LLRDDQVLDLVVGGLRDDLLLDQLVLPLEGPGVDDLLGVGVADPGERLQLVHGGAVEVERRGLRSGALGGRRRGLGLGAGRGGRSGRRRRGGRLRLGQRTAGERERDDQSDQPGNGSDHGSPPLGVDADRSPFPHGASPICSARLGAPRRLSSFRARIALARSSISDAASSRPLVRRRAARESRRRAISGLSRPRRCSSSACARLRLSSALPNAWRVRYVFAWLSRACARSAGRGSPMPMVGPNPGVVTPTVAPAGTPFLSTPTVASGGIAPVRTPTFAPGGGAPANGPMVAGAGVPLRWSPTVASGGSEPAITPTFASAGMEPRRTPTWPFEVVWASARAGAAARARAARSMTVVRIMGTSLAGETPTTPSL